MSDFYDEFDVHDLADSPDEELESLCLAAAELVEHGKQMCSGIIELYVEDESGTWLVTVRRTAPPGSRKVN